jgi:hypothetical protein
LIIRGCVEAWSQSYCTGEDRKKLGGNNGGGGRNVRARMAKSPF